MRYATIGRAKAALLALLLVAAAMPWADASAHRGHRGGVRLGIHLGVPLYSPWYYGPYYYPPAYYPPAVVAVPTEPPVYIERAEEDSAPGPANYWYYCDRSETYYPYVKKCPGGWRKVLPRPEDE